MNFSALVQPKVIIGATSLLGVAAIFGGIWYWRKKPVPEATLIETEEDLNKAMEAEFESVEPTDTTPIVEESESTQESSESTQTETSESTELTPEGKQIEEKVEDMAIFNDVHEELKNGVIAVTELEIPEGDLDKKQRTSLHNKMDKFTKKIRELIASTRKKNEEDESHISINNYLKALVNNRIDGAKVSFETEDKFIEKAFKSALEKTDSVKIRASLGEEFQLAVEAYSK